MTVKFYKDATWHDLWNQKIYLSGQWHSLEESSMIYLKGEWHRLKSMTDYPYHTEIIDAGTQSANGFYYWDQLQDAYVHFGNLYKIKLTSDYTLVLVDMDDNILYQNHTGDFIGDLALISPSFKEVVAGASPCPKTKSYYDGVCIISDNQQVTIDVQFPESAEIVILRGYDSLTNLLSQTVKKYPVKAGVLKTITYANYVGERMYIAPPTLVYYLGENRFYTTTDIDALEAINQHITEFSERPVRHLNLSGNDLDPGSFALYLSNVVDSNIENGWMDISNQSTDLSSNGYLQANIATLRSRGWTVID